MFISKVLRHYHTLKPWITTKSNHFLDLSIKSASKCHYILEDNTKIVDFSSGLMVTNLGHNNKYINQRMKDFIDKGLLYAPPSILIEEREKLSQRLIEISPIEKGKVFYTNGGADANESAVYFAKNSSKKSSNRILRFRNSFHGGSSYIASYLGGDKRRDAKLNHFNLDLIGDNILPNPKMSDRGEESLQMIKQIFEREYKSICGILIEGSSGTGGIYTYPKDYLNSLGNLAKKYDILIIVDEVMIAEQEAVAGLGDGGYYEIEPLSGVAYDMAGIDYDSAQYGDAYSAPPDLSIVVGQMAVRGREAFMNRFSAPPKRMAGEKRASSSMAGKMGHRWGRLIKSLGWYSFSQLAKMPPAQRRKLIRTMKSSAMQASKSTFDRELTGAYQGISYSGIEYNTMDMSGLAIDNMAGIAIVGAGI